MDGFTVLGINPRRCVFIKKFCSDELIVCRICSRQSQFLNLQVIAVLNQSNTPAKRLGPSPTSRIWYIGRLDVSEDLYFVLSVFVLAPINNPPALCV